MLINNSTVYSTNFARAAAYCLGTCAPLPSDHKRLAAYRLITSIYESVAIDPKAMGFNPVPDAPLKLGEYQKGHEADVKNIRDAIKKVEDIICDLYKLVCDSEQDESSLLLPESMRQPRKAVTAALQAAGATIAKGNRIRISMPDGCAEGLKELAFISRGHMIHITDSPIDDKEYLFFSRCVFEPSHNWVAEAFDKMLCAEGRLIQLCSELEKRGYSRIDCRDGKKVSLDYVKEHGKKPEPVKYAWGERTHTGIEVTYDELRAQPCTLYLRMPMFKDVLSGINGFEPGITDFIIKHTKTCDGCRYCVQTDKTGKRPLAAFDIGGTHKCPYYPGFTMNWRELRPELYGNILKTIDALDKFFT